MQFYSGVAFETKACSFNMNRSLKSKQEPRGLTYYLGRCPCTINGIPLFPSIGTESGPNPQKNLATSLTACSAA